MGSYRKAVMAGFICRLCSEQKRSVIHLYSRKAGELSLMEKIQLLPITVSVNETDNGQARKCKISGRQVWQFTENSMWEVHWAIKCSVQFSPKDP